MLLAQPPRKSSRSDFSQKTICKKTLHASWCGTYLLVCGSGGSCAAVWRNGGQFGLYDIFACAKVRRKTLHQSLHDMPAGHASDVVVVVVVVVVVAPLFAVVTSKHTLLPRAPLLPPSLPPSWSDCSVQPLGYVFSRRVRTQPTIRGGSTTGTEKLCLSPRTCRSSR